MSKNLKTLVCCILALVFVAGTVVAVFADSAALKNVELASDEVSTEDVSEDASEEVSEPVSEAEPVSVPETYLMGDVNLDGKITAADARLALRASATLEVLTHVQSILANANHDNEITANDARAILRVSAGLDKMFKTIVI